MALISAANVRAEVQGLTSADDTELGLLIAEADALAASYLYFPPVSATPTAAPTLSVSTYVDYLDGPARDDYTRLDLRVRPVASITSIYDDPDRLYGAGELVASSEYTLDGEAGVVRIDGDATHAWTTARRAIKVTYTAGWTDGSAPADLRRALLEIVGSLWRRRHLPGLPSATPVEQDAHLIPIVARQALGRYRLWEAAARG